MIPKKPYEKPVLLEDCLEVNELGAQCEFNGPNEQGACGGCGDTQTGYCNFAGCTSTSSGS